MHTLPTLLTTALLLTLAACGGGGDAAINPPKPVTDITATALSYGKTATFTITGESLDTGDISVSVNHCSGLNLMADSTATQRRVSCRITATGPLQIDTKTANGDILLSRSFAVPEPRVQLQTSLGVIVLELNPTASPMTVTNYLAYVNNGFYGGTIFHRVIPGFVVQGGGFTAGLGVKSPLIAPIALETPNGLNHLRGTVAMARTSEPNTATSQFFFNLQANPALNYASATAPGYAVFGVIKDGLNIMDAIAAVPTTSSASTGLTHVPATDVTILSATQIQ